jgi:hypothetical protein
MHSMQAAFAANQFEDAIKHYSEALSAAVRPNPPSTELLTHPSSAAGIIHPLFQSIPRLPPPRHSQRSSRTRRRRERDQLVPVLGQGMGAKGGRTPRTGEVPGCCRVVPGGSRGRGGEGTNW